MADEFKHKDVGDQITKEEYHSILAHEADSQAAGDLLYCDGTAWKRVAVGGAGLYLKAAAVPYWEAILDADIPATICRDTELATHAADDDAHHAVHLKTLVDHPLAIIPTMDDAHIPAAIARDAEVATAVSDHAALTTGIHGVGALHAAGFHAAGQAVSKVIWKDVSERALEDVNRTTTLDWTDLDLTAYTSANAKLVILRLIIGIDSINADGQARVEIRKNGTTPDHVITHRADYDDGYRAGGGIFQQVIVALDAGQIMEYRLQATGTVQWDTWIDVLGYIE